MTKNEMMNLIKKAYKDGYRDFGVRAMDTEYQAGEDVPDSYDWDIENDCSTYNTTGETLPGACAVFFAVDGIQLDEYEDAEENLNAAIEQAKRYYCDHLYIIASKFGSEWGNDQNEIILRDAQVIAVIE